MTSKLTIGPPIITINQGTVFMVCDLRGQINAESELGIFADDTRFLSYYAIFVDGEPWNLISSTATDYCAARFYLTNPLIKTEFGTIDQSSLAMVIDRKICTGISESIKITNHSLFRLRFNFEIAMRSDFADIFEVRAHSFIRRGQVFSSWNHEKSHLLHTYKNEDFQRHFLYRVIKAEPSAIMSNGRLSFRLDLEPGQRWDLNARFELITKAQLPDFQDEDENNDDYDDQQKFKNMHSQWKKQATQLTSTNEEFYRLFNQSVSDIGALRLHEDPLEAKEPPIASWTLAAGVPWYNTIFGRDSLIASNQCMLVNPDFILGALNRLGQLQSTDFDEFKDSQPGKIPHELRSGELAYLHKIPHTPYYGTADATPLYLISLHEAWKWLGNLKELADYLPIADKCLAWIDQSGDLDGDGFQEYLKMSSGGLENQGWKDSDEAIMYPDGSIVRGKKALCELQGYVYDAWLRTAELFENFGRIEEAKTLREKAKVLKQKFNQVFWSEKNAFFALALDENKKPVESAASNVAHCLWSGIVEEKYAACVVARLMQPDFFSGWGIRTLSASHPAFNPHSYHCGSVWPHDNGIAALGFKRYGFTTEVGKVARDISRAASYFEGNRLPELYAGIQREDGAFPVQYVKANIPQAWAAGSIFHLLKAILGLQADAPNHSFYVDPVLPPWLNDLHLRKIRVGNSVIDLKFWKTEDQTLWDATVTGDDIKVAERKITAAAL